MKKPSWHKDVKEELREDVKDFWRDLYPLLVSILCLVLPVWGYTVLASFGLLIPAISVLVLLFFVSTIKKLVDCNQVDESEYCDSYIDISKVKEMEITEK